MAGLKKKQLNFLAAAKRNVVGRRNRRLKESMFILIPAVFAGVILLSSFYNQRKIYQLNQKIQEIEGRIVAQEHSVEIEELNRIREEMFRLEQWKKDIELLHTSVLRKRELDQNVFDVLFSSVDGSISEVRYENGSLFCSVTVSSYLEIPEMVKGLEHSGVFESISYTGFTKGEEYRFTLECQLKVESEENAHE